MKMRIPYSGLPKSVYTIFFARVVNTIGNFVHPFMTLLLTIKMGMVEQEVGKYLLLAAILQIPGALLGGKLSDFAGRKNVAMIFMTLAALCLLPCAFLIESPSGIVFVPWLLIMTSFFNSVVGPTNSAMMNDLTTPANRREAFTLLYLGANAGTAIGCIVAGFLFNNYMQLLFIGDALTTLIAVAILMVNIKETKPTPDDIKEIDHHRSGEKVVDGGMIHALLKRPRLLIFIVLDLAFAFVYAQTWFSLPLQAKTIFGPELGANFYGTFSTINCIVVIVLTTLITLLTRKIRSVYNVSLAGVFFAVGFGMLFFVNDFWLFALSTVVWTIGEIIHATNVGVYIANHTPISHRGRFNAFTNIVTSIGSSISPYLIGIFIVSYGVVNVWPIMFVICMVAVVAMFILGSTEKINTSKCE